MTLLALHPPGDYVSDEIRRTSTYFEVAILEELKQRVRARGVIVDAGAHIGNHTAFFAAHLPHTEIHAFEPWPDTIALLRRNVGDRDRVFIHPQALSDRRRGLTMLPDSNLGHSRIAQGGTVSVEAVPLDDLDLREVTLLKIDVEGHEPQVLAGAEQTIARWHPLILVEDWKGEYGPLLPGYRVAMDWAWTHQTYLYEWAR